MKKTSRLSKGLQLEPFGYVWFPENTKERKKFVQINDFPMFDYSMKNIKENRF